MLSSRSRNHASARPRKPSMLKVSTSGPLDSLTNNQSYRTIEDSTRHPDFRSKSNKRYTYANNENAIEKSVSRSKLRLTIGKMIQERSLERDHSYLSIEKTSYFKEFSTTSPIPPGPGIKHMILYTTEKDDSALVGKRARSRGMDDKASTGESATANIYRDTKHIPRHQQQGSFGKTARTGLAATVDQLKRIAENTKKAARTVGHSKNLASGQITFRR